MEKDQTEKTKMTISVNRRFQRILNTLASASGMSRDEFVEHAIRKAYGKEIAVIEAELFKEDEESGMLPPTELSTRLVLEPAG